MKKTESFTNLFHLIWNAQWSKQRYTLVKLYMVHQTEKAVLLSYGWDGHEFTFWCPKSVFNSDKNRSVEFSSVVGADVDVFHKPSWVKVQMSNNKNA